MLPNTRLILPICEYAQYDGSNWTVETVDQTGNIGVYTSLDIDPLGSIGIGYYDSSNANLRFALVQVPGSVPAFSRGGTELPLGTFLGIGMFALARKKAFA